MKRIIPVSAMILVLAAALVAQAGPTTVKLQFHLQMQFAEQDVYIERAAGHLRNLVARYFRMRGYDLSVN